MDHTKQDILEEFLRCELYYHCRALEVLAPALLHIGGVNAESAREVGGFRTPEPTGSPWLVSAILSYVNHRVGEPVCAGDTWYVCTVL